LPVDQWRLPRPDKSGFVRTENVSPSPYPLPSRARECRKNLPSRERGYRKNIPLQEEGMLAETKDVYHSIHIDMVEENETILILFRRSKRLSLL
jgi:hypothetical protein